MHYRNDLSALTTAGVSPAQTLLRMFCRGCAAKGKESSPAPKVNGSGCSPRGCGIRDQPGAGFRCLNRCPCCCSHPSSSRQGWHRSHTELPQTCPQHSCCLRPPGVPKRELAPHFQAAGIHHGCSGVSCGRAPAPGPGASPAEPDSHSEPQSSPTPVTSLSVPPERGV